MQKSLYRLLNTYISISLAWIHQPLENNLHHPYPKEEKIKQAAINIIKYYY